MSQGKRRVLAVIDDLLFTVKIADTAKRTGLSVDFVKAEADVFAKLPEKPLVIILDLNTHALDPIQLIQRLKADEQARGVSIVGYVSHVHGELKQRAHDAGCDMVMARSAFSQNLPQIFKRYSGIG